MDNAPGKVELSLQYLDDSVPQIAESLHDVLLRRNPTYCALTPSTQNEIVYQIVAALRESVTQQDIAPLVAVAHVHDFHNKSGSWSLGGLLLSEEFSLCSLVRHSVIVALRPCVLQNPSAGMAVLECLDTLLIEADSCLLEQRRKRRTLVVRQGADGGDQYHKPTHAGDSPDQLWTDEAYRVLVEHSLQGLFIIQNRRLVFANPMMAAITGYTVEELMGQTLEDVHALIHPDDSTIALDSFHQCLPGRPAPLHYESRILHKQGDVRNVEMSVAFIEYRGKPAMLGTCIDITERKRMEEALRESENKFRSIVEQSPDGILITDEDGLIIEWNRGAEQIIGYKRDAVLGQYYWDVAYALIPEEQRSLALFDSYKASVREYLKTGQSSWEHTLQEQEIQRPDGTRIYINYILFAIKTSKGGMFCAGFHDTTLRKQTEAELARATKAAEAAVLARTEFLASMSHEIRTPLNAILGMTSLLLKTTLTPKQYDCVETAHTSGNALLTIINDILDFSKIEAGKLVLEQRPFDVRVCVEETLDLLATKAAEKNLDLAYQVEDALPRLFIGDVTRLRQVLINLVGNAIKFTEAGEVVVSVQYHTASPPPLPIQDISSSHHTERHNARQELLLTVRDTGIGIAQESLNRLFQSFTQEDASIARKYGGSGLGLTISKRLVEMMGGRLWVESDVGKGSTFFFTIATDMIPEEDAETYPESPRLPAYARSNHPLLAGKRVLLVDDTITSCAILTQRTRQWGMSCCVATSDLDALKLLRQGKTFDVAILDILLPEMDSLTLAAAMRSNPITRDLPLVVFISAGLSIKAAQSSGIERAVFQTRPIKPELLYEALVGVLSGSGYLSASHLPRFEHIAPSPALSPSRRRKLSLLLAEDTPGNQKVALYFLEHMGYRADVAQNGLEVLDALKRNDYDVVFMDVQMPEMDGYETTRHIRASLPPERQPWIIAMTAHAIQGDREKCLDSGMDDYVSKPVREEELERALESVGKHEQPLQQEESLLVETATRSEENSLAVGEGTTRPATETVAVVAEPQPAQPLEPEQTERFLKTIRKGGAGVMREIIAIFIKDMSERVASLQKAVVQNSVNDLKAAAHSLKSLSAQVGAMTLSRYSHQLEMMGYDGTMDGATDLVTRAGEEYQRVEVALKQREQQEIGEQCNSPGV